MGPLGTATGQQVGRKAWAEGADLPCDGNTGPTGEHAATRESCTVQDCSPQERGTVPPSSQQGTAWQASPFPHAPLDSFLMGSQTMAQGSKYWVMS